MLVHSIVQRTVATECPFSVDNDDYYVWYFLQISGKTSRATLALDKVATRLSSLHHPLYPSEWFFLLLSKLL